MGRVLLDCVLGVLAGKLALIAVAFGLGAIGVGFPNGIGTVLPAFLGVFWAARQLAERYPQVLTSGEAWTAAALAAGGVILVEAGFTTIAIAASGRMGEVAADGTFLQILAVSSLLVGAVTFALSRLMFPLFHQQEAMRVQKQRRDRGR